MPKSSAHMIVVTMERLGFIQRRESDSRYVLGIRSRALGQVALRAFCLAEDKHPALKSLTDDAGMPAHVAVADRDQALCIQKVAGSSAVQFDTYPGRRFDFHCTALGKVILAFGPADVSHHSLAKETHVRHTVNTIFTPRELQREIKSVQRLSYAVDDEEEELDVRCVAAPLIGEDGVFVAALSVTGTSSQIPLNRIEGLAERLQRSANELRSTLSSGDAVRASA